MGADETGRRRLAARIEDLMMPVCVALGVLSALAGASIVALIGASVVMRHLANAPFRFTEELVGLLMTAAFFLALPLVTLRAEHVRVQIALTALPARFRRPVETVANLLGVGFCTWLVWLAWPWFEFAFARGIRTEVARLLLYPWMALLPVSLVLTGIAFCVRAASPLQGGAAR